MAQWYRCTVTIQNDNGLPKDAVTNTFHYMIEGSGDRLTLAADFDAQLDAFYTAWVPDCASSDYDWSAPTTKHYDFLDPVPRIPFYESSISPGSPATSAYDWTGEVAICLSMEGERESGVNMRRRRGRVFLGPLAPGVADLPIVSSGFADNITAAADAAFFGAGTTHLAVYSPYTHHAVPVGENIKDYPDEVSEALPASFTQVQRMWCDNAFDTQRRRGRGPTYRSTVNA